MQLTTLEIKGFKSFAEKTTIHFNNNITGIVGPNGCGKSNVVDSIRWVLGEQKTSHLRLEKMENLIFNGTRSRKAASLAEVSLTFENTKNLVSSDYKTITITRRLFRDGESEYRLNDVTCRLKDISNLFMDTGVGSDSYAIIELGMMDEILNDRENSRRKLFEQAAGISKYKKRKKETIEKLKSTDADLERVKDLLFEIESNLKQLEKQAHKTKKFYELKEEYKNLSLILAKFSLQDYKTKYKTLEVQKQQEDDNRIDIEAAIALAEAALEKEKLDNVAKERALFEIQKRLNALVSGVSDKENERNLLQSQLKFSRDKMESAEKQILDANDQLGLLAISIDKLKVDYNTEGQILSVKKEELSILEKELSTVREQHSSLKGNLDSERAAYAEKERQLVELEKQLAVNRSSNESLQQDLFASEEDTVSKRKDLELLKESLAGLKEQREAADKRLQTIVEHEENNRKQIQQLEQAVEKTRQELTQETRTLDAKRNEYELTKSLVENLEGFPESIKFLKKNAKWSKEAPLLSDIIYCAEEYRVAIENYLDPYLNYYVVQNMEEAVMAVYLLNDASKGRANFFILDEFEKYEPKKKVTIEGAKAASELVEMDAQYSKLGAYLLDRVYMIDDSKNFTVQQLDLKGEKVVLLTKSGRFIRSDFSLSGGAVGLFEGKKIGRAKNLEKLKEEIEKLEAKTAKLRQEASEAQSKTNQLKADTKSKEIEAQRKEVNELTNKQSGCEASIQSLVKFLESADAKSQSITQRLELLKQEVTRINTELSVLREQQLLHKAELEKKDASFIEATNRMSESSTKFNQKNIEFHQQQNRIHSINQELTFKTTQLDSFTNQSQRNKAVIEENTKLIEEHTAQLKTIENELLSGYSDREGFEKEVAACEKAYYDSRQQINEMETQVREQQRKREVILNSIHAVSEQFNELKLSLTSLKERLSVEFNIYINDIINEELDSKWKQEEIEADVQKMRKRVENFGEINPMAVEAYDEMKGRYDFIVAQKKDLEDAKNSLVNTMKEIEGTAKDLFLDAFTKVRENFIRVFRALFSEEDQCDLFLVNPDDPLESVIEITAKPKGKRPTVIDQLSGGEKTLTAIALLFSLYLLKPAPFCIFDEVDAPLDDTNIGKFNKIIHEFSKDSQFIIVTHNKQTMTAVDAIYGVTMPEQGVSRVVPVDFTGLN